MAQPSNSFSSYDAVGNREDLSDLIYDISPTDTPFLSKIPRVKAKATKHEWQIDALAAAVDTNAVVEGDDATTDASAATTRLDNQCQILDKVARVTGTQEKVDKAGRSSEMAYQMEKRMKEIKRDLEKSLFANKAKVVGNDTTARVLGGLQAWVKTNTSIASDATASAGNGSDIHTDGTARALQESFFETVLASAWDEGAEPSIGYLNKFQKRKIAAFTGNQTTMGKAEDRKVINSVDVYVDPLGNEVKLVPARQCPTDVVHFVDPEFAALAVLRDFQSTDLAKTGDSQRKQILFEGTLEVRNEKAHAAIYDLTAS